MTQSIRCPSYPFGQFQPVSWTPSTQAAPGAAAAVYSVKRDHGVVSRFCLHNPNDPINAQRRYLDKVIVEYQIGANSYNLFTINDLFEVPYALDERAAGNIMGDMAERIARRVTKYFLQHYSSKGSSGGIFDKRFDARQRNNFIVAHSDEYVLKIDNYPNLVILKRSGRGKFGYENIKELDGLFDYRHGSCRHIIVLESKLEKINVNCEDLINNLFAPLRQFFPEAHFSYILFSTTDAIYSKRHLERQRRIKQSPLSIYQSLAAQGIGTIFFTFNESYDDFERIKDHLITQYRSIAHLGVELHGRMRISDTEIELFDGGQTPHLRLVRDTHSGMWKEARLTHKSLATR